MFKSNILSIVILVMMTSLSCFAQDLPPEDEGIPVDGGVSILLAAGAIWGVKKLKEKN